MSIHTGFGGNTCHAYQHGLGHITTTDPLVAFSTAQTTDLNMASGSHKLLLTSAPPPPPQHRGHHQSIRQWHRPLISSWISGVVEAGAATWTIDINMASGGITDHSGSLRRSNPENEALPGGACAWTTGSGAEPASAKAPAVVHHSADHTEQCGPQPSLSPVTAISLQFHPSL